MLHRLSYVHGSVHCESVSVIVQQDATIYSFFTFLQTALHVSDATLTPHQEYTQSVITTFGTGRTVLATVRWRGGVGVLTPPRQRTVANTFRPVPDVITDWVCSWWWVRVSSETCRAVCRNVIKLYIVASCWTIIDADYLFTKRKQKMKSCAESKIITFWVLAHLT